MRPALLLSIAALLLAGCEEGRSPAAPRPPKVDGTAMEAPGSRQDAAPTGALPPATPPRAHDVPVTRG